MHIRFWAVRGSIASPGPDTAAVGGNTSCVEVTCGATRIVLDAGTGLRGLGNHLLANGPQPLDVTVLLSHYHWDHIANANDFAGATWLARKSERDHMFSGPQPERTVRGIREPAREKARHQLRNMRHERDGAVVVFGRHLDGRGAEIEGERLDEGEVGR